MPKKSGDVEQLVSPFIDGAAHQSENEGTLEIANPSNGLAFITIPSGCQADVDHAVDSARQAYDDGRWCDAPPSYRKATLHRLADLMAAEAGTLDSLDAGEMGKPIKEQFGNATAAANVVRFYAEAVDKVTGDVYCSDKTSFVSQRRVPRGVVAAVVPWNFPTYVAAIKIAPALAAGNSVVLKPSEMSSRSAIRLAELAIRAGLPPGVLNVVPGRGDIVGRALALHFGVDMLTFTGSTAVGKLMMQYAGQSNLKAVMAECGGKSPQIVFPDGVDLDAASEAIAKSMLANQGQVCSVGSRVLVHHSIESAIVERITEHFKNIVMGDAQDPATTFGPVVSAKQLSGIMLHIEAAAAEGARLEAGGRRALPESGGFFVEPTLFSNVSPMARVAQEEIFGPVLSVIPFQDEADAIRIANSTAYGLSAYVWTDSISTGLRVAKGIRSSVRINAVRPTGEGAGYAYSYEPAGQSGIGTEGGLAGMESYLRRQYIAITHA